MALFIYKIMTETRKNIIEIIEPYMDKTLIEGCLLNRIKYGEDDIVTLIDTDGVLSLEGYSGFVHYLSRDLQPYYFEDDVEFINQEQYLEIYKKGCEKGDIFGEEISRNCFKILGHYDITAVFDCINSINRDGVGVVYFDNIIWQKDYWVFQKTSDGKYIKIPKKPLNLYTEKEDEDLLELLKKLNKIVQ